MADKYQNKYRIPSARLASWDYSSNGAYFITLCTAERRHYFGEIVDGKMHLSEQGKIAHQCWLEIPDHFQSVYLDEFIVMPNHMHGIIVIDKPVFESSGVETLHATSLRQTQQNQSKQMSTMSPKQGSVSTIISSYKSAVTSLCTKNQLPFGWQTRFHDHIIRNNDEWERIRNYIINNPANWKEDKFFKNTE